MAHPRSRGEHIIDRGITNAKLGSSPLARGTLRAVAGLGGADRLIPARAGNTGVHSRRRTSRPAHPRSRGEHVARRWSITCTPGSSPLARGTLRCGTFKVLKNRLIPARAGNMNLLSARKRGSAAHPRSRGEHLRSSGGICIKSGSSPLARGTYLVDGLQNVGCRLIPARAGNMIHPAIHPKIHPAHPRSRGEHSPFSFSPLNPFGSSPLARGTSICILMMAPFARLIPARAGNIRPE